MNHYTLELIGFIKKRERVKIINKLWEIKNLEIIEKITCPTGSNKNTREHINYAKESFMRHFEVIVDYFENEFDIKLRRRK